MIFVYINKPNPHFTIHNKGCHHIQVQNVENQRYENISNSERIFSFLDSFKDTPFDGDKNKDMWLEINLGSKELNEGLIYVLREINPKLRPNDQKDFPIKYCGHCN
jgi:hypothetical protein